MDIEDFSFLDIEFATKSETIQERYHDIIDSVEFAASIRNLSKIDYEFNNLLDLLDDIDCEELDKVFAIWKDVIDDNRIEYYE